MRILPLLVVTENLDIEERYLRTQEISSITHMHFRSVFACFIYLEYALLLFKGIEKFQAYEELKHIVRSFLTKKSFNPIEISLFDRILNGDMRNIDKDKIQSSGYVLHTLEASLWCFLTSDSFEQTVIKSVNLGEDTDTTGAVAGGIAGLYWGIDNIPKSWVENIARSEDLFEISKRLSLSVTGDSANTG
jgi:ADP-ribosylglycohydrolase